MNPLTPTQMKNIFYRNGGTGRYETWTQVEKLTEWPPGESAVFMFYKGNILVGASAKDKSALDAWRRKHTMRTLPNSKFGNNSTARISYKHDKAWLEMHQQGYKQIEIAKKLGVSPAYVSIIKKRYYEKKWLTETRV